MQQAAIKLEEFEGLRKNFMEKLSRLGLIKIMGIDEEQVLF